MSNNRVKHLYISRKNIIYYLDNLGYDVSEYNKFNIAEINAMEQNTKSDNSELDFEVYKTNEDGLIEICTVMYYIKNNIKQNILEAMVTDYYEQKQEENKENCNLIIVSFNAMNDSLHKSIKSMWKKYQEYVVLLDIQSLQFNILEHSFVPKHIKLTNEEKNELYEKFNIKNNNQLPEISMFDPVAKIILLKPGAVCKIIRYYKISIVNEFYRVCVV